MDKAEHHATKMSYNTMHLSTHDKVSLYSHLGYVEGSKVSPLRKCVANLTDKQVHTCVRVVDTTEEVVTVFAECRLNECTP